MWTRAGAVLSRQTLEQMIKRINRARRQTISVIRESLGDWGANAGCLPAVPITGAGFPLGAEGFVKFSGVGSDRADSKDNVLTEIDRSGMHRVCSYPAAKAPRGPRDGDTMFLSRLTRSPNDVIVYGRAVAHAFDESKDRATAADIRKRPFKKYWPLYIRVHNAEFVAGTLDNGVRLSSLIKTFNEFSFASTERRALAGERNINPRASLRQKADVRLTESAKNWLNSELEDAFAKHGTVPKARLDKLP